MMLLKMHLRSKSLSNSSATSGFVWEEFDFKECEGVREGTYIWASCTMLCFALGFPASVAILWEMFKTYRRETPLTPNNFFQLNLCVMDAVFLAFIPSGILNHFIWQSWMFEAFWNGVYALNTCGRPLLMACICLDCYMAVVHPITYHKRKSLTPRVVMAGIVWTLTVACGIAYCLFHKLYLSFFSTVPFLIAILTVAICDSFILLTLVRSDAGRKNIHPQKQRAIQTLISSLVTAAISYVPPVLLMVIGKQLFTSFNVFMCTAGIPITITSTLGSAVMPLLHLKDHGKLDRFRLGCCRKS